MTPALPATFTVQAWRRYTATGHPVDSRYTDDFWTPTIGPTAMAAWRRLARVALAHPEGHELVTDDWARCLGRQARDAREILGRLAHFRLLLWPSPHALPGLVVVRTEAPTLTAGRVARLPDSLRRAHEAWQQGVGVGR